MTTMKYEAVKGHIWLKVPVLNENHPDQPLNSIDCLVYSYLLFLAQKQNGATQTDICTSLRIDRNSGKRSLSTLSRLGLVQTDGVNIRAIDSVGASADIFRVQKKAKGKWFAKFVYDRVHLPTSSSVLSVRTNLLFWHLVKKGEPVEKMPGHLRVGGSGSRFLTDRYLANGLNCSRKTAHSCLKRLEKLGLLRTHPYSKGFAVGIFPLTEKGALWRERWQDRPKEAPALTVNELFGTPSPATVETEFPWEQKIRQILRSYGIVGKLGEELTGVLVEDQPDPTVWRPMLQQAHADHFANREDGKTRQPHCGYLFRANLYEYLQQREYNRINNPQFRYKTADEMRLGDALATLTLNEKEHSLIEEALEAEYLRSDSGDMVPCRLDMDTATELAEKAKGNKSAFKLAVAGMLFGEHIITARRWRWYREWTRKKDEILPDTKLLEMVGIQPYAIQDVRDKLRVIYFQNGQQEDMGEATRRVNLLTKVASWQMCAHSGANEEIKLVRAAQEIAEAAGVVAVSDKEVGCHREE